MTIVGKKGKKIRSDVQVTVTDAGKCAYDLESSVMAMYGASIRRQIGASLARFGEPAIHLLVQDSGALPFAIEARLEAAICAHLGLDLPPIARRDFDAPRDRLRRTRLYLPGDEPKMFANAPLYGSDMLVLDLEDSVAPDSKFAARAMVRRALATLDWGGCERVLRINTGSQGLRDIETVARQGVQAILVPKAENAETIAEIAAKLDDLDLPTALIPLIESAKGVIEAYAIASASPRVVAITIGLEDYVTDLGAERTASGDESAYAHGQLVNAARAAGVTPLASVFPKGDDPDATYDYALRMRGLGFEGIGCIHPRQVRAVHRAFVPSADEIDLANAIVEAYERAVSEGHGAVAVRGRMVDAPVYQRARKTLRRGGAK